jgi:hypothetical protein
VFVLVGGRTTGDVIGGGVGELTGDVVTGGALTGHAFMDDTVVPFGHSHVVGPDGVGVVLVGAGVGCVSTGGVLESVRGRLA